MLLKIPLDHSLDVGHKSDEFSETLLKKGLEFVLNKWDGTGTFNLDLWLLPAEVDTIPEKKSCKGDELRAGSIGHVKMILILLTKVVALYVIANVVQVKVLGFE